MNVRELEGPALDYWCARALVEPREEIRFTQTERAIVVTFTHGDIRWLDQRFAPSSEWGDAGIVLDLAREARFMSVPRRHGAAGGGANAAEVECVASFGGRSGEPASDDAELRATGPDKRVALLRAFLLHRFGETVDDAYPASAHAVRDGVVTPYQAGEALPSYADAARGDEGDETGDIKSMPR